MALRIIKGPPNSGRTERLRQLYIDALPRNPILVVPSTDDIFTWQERLTRERDAFLGGHVQHFRDLIETVLAEAGAGASGSSPSQLASPLRRRSITADALASEWPSVASRLDNQPGLIDAALRLVDELRENLVDPDTMRRRAAESESGVPDRLVNFYELWCQLLEQEGLDDQASLGQKAAHADVAGWKRPVFVAGFDDLTFQQFTLLGRLAGVTDVTVAITHDPESEVKSPADRLLSRLQDLSGSALEDFEQSERDQGRDQTLADISRHLRDPDAVKEIPPSDSVRLLRSAGHRGEAVQVGARIASLVAGGVEPDDIAIAIDSPGTDGVVFRDLLAEYDLPATVEAETTAPETATGQAVLGLLRARESTGSAADLLALARGPLGLDSATIDAAEYRIRRFGLETAGEAERELRQAAGLPRNAPSPLPGWDRLGKGDVKEAVGEVTGHTVSALLKNATGRLDDALATETATATAILDACEELERIDGQVTSTRLRRALLSGAVKVWSVPRTGTVTIASPYSLRAKRFRYLFIVSLQERSLGDPDGGPFLSADARRALQLPEMEDPENQELYLFHSCLSVPTDGLILSTRTSDVHGKAEAPSPLIREVETLFTETAPMIRTSTGAKVVFPVGKAPSHDELLRSLVATAADPPAGFGFLEERLAKARETETATRTLGPLSRDVLDATASQAGNSGGRSADLLSASGIEAFLSCPYRWFFERALSPQRFGPEPEAMARGSLIHETLATLYRNHPGEIPTPDTLSDWKAEAAAVLPEEARSDGIRLGSDSAGNVIERRRALVDVERFLTREASRRDEFRPVAIETKFGYGKPEGPDRQEALKLEKFSLLGRIDRIEASPDGETAVILDYKSGDVKKLSLVNLRRNKKIQIHLYMMAVAELWDFKRVIAGLYLPLGRGDGRARGVLAEGALESLSGFNPVKTDVTKDLEGELGEAAEIASDAAGKLLEGAIFHHPGQCLHHYEHAGVPDPKLSAPTGGIP